ncbi:hypothetical protein [Aeromicrobium sp. UC242_57]|uniref:hypothetical protein n=1 Tax=Aeromicrobium sp. UC242_57 TaxID=3374624 RepID=UPI003795383A
MTFSKPWPDNTEPDVLLTPNGPGWSSKGAYVTNVTATSFDLYVETALTASTTYRMNFFAVG